VPSRQIRVALAATLATLLAVESVLHLRQDRLEAPLEWYYKRAQLEAAALDALDAAGIRSDLAFIGTSQVRRGIQIPIFEEGLASVTEAHNLALPAAQTTVVRRWVLEQIVPHIAPRRVVWGVSSLDFNPNRKADPLESYNAARATRPGMLGSIDRLLGTISLLSSHRGQLRDPRAWLDLATGPVIPRDGVDSLIAGLSPNNDTTERDVTRGALQRIRNNTLRGFAVGEQEVVAFVATLSDLREMDIEVAVVFMPVPTGYVDLHPNGEADFELFRTTVSDALSEAGIPLFDYSREYAPSAFFDLTHLLGSQAKHFSRRLAEDLETLGW
jgi:hypothetical protein